MRTCAAQISLKPGEVGENLSRCLSVIEESQAAGVDLLVLPECAFSGYILDEGSSRFSVGPWKQPGSTRLLDSWSVTGLPSITPLL